MQVVWRDWCVLRHFSATDVRIERSKRRSTNGHDHAEGHNRYSGAPGELRLGDGDNGGHDPATAGKLAAPCGPQARAQRGPGPPLLPGKVRSHGSDRWDIFHFFRYPLSFFSFQWKKQILRCYICFYNFLTVRVVPGHFNGITTIFFFTSLCLSMVKERSHRYQVIKRNRKAITLLKI